MKVAEIDIRKNDREIETETIYIQEKKMVNDNKREKNRRWYFVRVLLVCKYLKVCACYYLDQRKYTKNIFVAKSNDYIAGNGSF